jgi:2-polyprenyl-6-methoxyphenol hydroxylase-like FAD-dependent oxidoreductase
MKIAVAGAGFAGLASAALLARDGHRVTVYERFQEPRAVGAGILLQPSGLAALRVLGIDEVILRKGSRIDRLLGVTPSGRHVVDIRYGQWRDGAFGVGLHRGVLFDALWKLARGEGAAIVTGHECTDLAALRSRHSLVVIADGCRSRLRGQSGLACTDRVYPWGAVWAVLDDAPGRYGNTLWQWYRGAGQMLGIMPTGIAPGGRTPVVSLFWSLHAERLAAWRAAGLDGFKQQVVALHPGCEALLSQLGSLDELTWARYHDIEMPAYHGERCVVVGDAAHATSPQLGQGTNLALLDALALRDALRSHPELPAALERYTALRLTHNHFYGQASRWLTPLFQSDRRFLPWLRDVFMGWGSRWPVAGPLARRTLVGVQTGWAPGATITLP